MAIIKIDDLRPTGAELFSDSENYLNELGDGDLDMIYGGGLSSLIRSIAKSVAIVSKPVIKSVARGSRAVSRAATFVYRNSPRIPRPNTTFSQYCTIWF